MSDAPNTPARVTRNTAVKQANEQWATFELDDGTVIRTRLLIQSVRRVVDAYDPKGGPEYEWMQMPQIEVVSPPELWRQEPPQKLDS